MLAYNDPLNAEIVKLIRGATGTTLPVYNALMLDNPPAEAERIEFRLTNFVSTGQIYETADVSAIDTYKVGTISEYRCQLMIRVLDDPMTCAVTTGMIAGAIQTFQYLEQFAVQLYIKNETMRILPFTIQKDNTIVNFQEILVDCYVGIPFERNIDFFTKLEDFEVQIKTTKMEV